jgi:hypothetical protein
MVVRMSGERSTAEIVVELRALYGTVPARAVREAADRLEARDALRPPCPTCGGTAQSSITKQRAIGATKPLVYTVENHCPDCPDGRVPWERLVKRWEDVEEMATFDMTDEQRIVFDRLRSIR